MKFSPSSNKDHLMAIMKPSIEDGKTLVLKSDQELVDSLKTFPQEIDFNAIDPTFNTILYLASANNYPQTVAYLLTERHVNPNVKVCENLMAAHIAAVGGHTDVLKLLAACPGIRFAEQDQFGETPLFRALGNAPEKKLCDTVTVILSVAPASKTSQKVWKF